jgi:hypothetical protein
MTESVQEDRERERLPNRRGSLRFPIGCGGQLYLVTLSKFDDGRLAEIFLDTDKPDSALATHASDAAILASMLLQHGVLPAAISHSVAGPIKSALEAFAAHEAKPNGND